MAQRLHHEYSTDGTVRAAHVREAVAGLTGDDLTEKSPIAAGGAEVGVEVSGDVVHVRVEGHDGEWSKTSETALKRVVKGIEGVEELEASEGGYEEAEETDDGDVDEG